MNITISESSSIPIYEQIIIQIIRGLKNNEINPSDSLPSIRQLSKDLCLTNTTIAKTYQILERGKIISTGGRRGTFIHSNALENAEKFIQEMVFNQFNEFILHQMQYGVTKNEISRIFNEILESLNEEVK